jgi:toxin HigB-1
VLQDAKTMARVYGDRAKTLRLRLAVLAEAKCLADVPSGTPDHCHALRQNRKGQFAVTLYGNWRLVFRPNHDPVPQLKDGGPDLSAITAIELIEVVDYHKE